jgi:hypothetical protein
MVSDGHGWYYGKSFELTAGNPLPSNYLLVYGWWPFLGSHCHGVCSIGNPKYGGEASHLSQIAGNGKNGKNQRRYNSSEASPQTKRNAKRFYPENGS